MSSLVTDVLLSSGKLEKKDLPTQIAALSSNSYKTKKEIFDTIHKKYASFSSNVLSCQGILKEFQDVQNEVKEVEIALSSNVIGQLKDSTKNFERLSEEHAQTVKLLEVLDKICKIDNFFDNYKTAMANSMFVDAAEALQNAELILSSIDSSTTLSNIEIFKCLQKSHTLNKEDLLFNLDNIWKENVAWKLPKGDDEDVLATSLQLNNLDDKSDKKDDKKVDRSVVLGNCIKALHKINGLNIKLKKLGEYFINHIVEPLVTKTNLKPEISPVNDKFKLSLKYSSKSESSPEKVFTKVAVVLKFLWKCLLHFKTSDGNNADTAMSVFSEFTAKKVINLLLDNCLAMTIPKTKEELGNYDQISKAVDDFEKTLCQIDFLPPNVKDDSVSLSSYAANINAHFANQQCKDILAKARTLMLNEVRNTIEVCNEDKEENLPQLKKKNKDDNQMILRPVGTTFKSADGAKTLSDNTLKMPKCAVSVCAKEIIQLAYGTLCESANADPIRTIQLVHTVHDIFELFAAIVPVYHREELDKLPRLSAIHYNDCMYISHHLLTIGHQFLSVTSMFVSKVPMFRKLGAECFLNQMKMQREQLMECMKPIFEFSVSSSTDKNNNAERAVKQVMYQLNHLRKIWIDILPHEVLKKSLGTLVNSCIKEHVDCICKMEDISAEDSVSLKLLSQLLADQVPGLFEFNEVKDMSWQKFVPKWNRLIELIRFLNCSLVEIVDRWADGKGPLAATFSITEVKSLIRSLFRNTDHRANALLKIRI